MSVRTTRLFDGMLGRGMGCLGSGRRRLILRGLMILIIGW